MNSHFQFWWRWLVVVACGTLLFGIALIALPNFMNQVFNAVFFSASQAHLAFDAGAATYIKFVYGVLGAVMVGWAVLLLLTLIGPFRSGQREAWQSLVASIAIWFVVDSSYSVWAGFWQNAILNAVFFVGFAVPLVATYHFFRGAVRMRPNWVPRTCDRNR
jgi:hypothetical protein